MNSLSRELFQRELITIKESDDSMIEKKERVIKTYINLFKKDISTLKEYLETESKLIEAALVMSKNEVESISTELNNFYSIKENNSFSYLIEDEIERREERVNFEKRKVENYSKILKLYKFVCLVLMETAA